MRVSVMRIRFNPRQYVGCDFCSMVIFVALLLFQSTHPRRVRHDADGNKISLLCFNLRTHVGCDQFCKDIQDSGKRFNPRTHVGCDSERSKY